MLLCNGIIICVSSILLLSVLCEASRVAFCALYVLSRCVIFRQYTCQDVSSFGNTPVKMCHLSAGGFGSAMEATAEMLIALLHNVQMYNMQHLRMDYKHVCLCKCTIAHAGLITFNLLHEGTFAKHPLCLVPFMYCQDVSSFDNTPVKMYHLSAGGFGSAMKATQGCTMLGCNVQMHDMRLGRWTIGMCVPLHACA